jgi:hypothetical protein
MTATSDFTDRTKCPLCGDVNECAIAAGKDAESCWCMAVTMSPDVLKAIPPEARNRVCICARCARKENHGQEGHLSGSPG